MTVKRICAVSVALMCLLLGGCKLLTDAEKLQQYRFGDDTISTPNSIVGERKVSYIGTSIKNGVSERTYTYTGMEDPRTDMESYVTHLRENENFKLIADLDLSQSSGTADLAKQSSDTDKIIVVSIVYDSNGYTVVLQKGKGTLEIS